MPDTRSTVELNAAVEEKVDEFKIAFIEQMNFNLREVFKDEIRQIINGELKYIEKLFSTVSLLQKHVNTLRERKRERERERKRERERERERDRERQRGRE